MSKSIPLDVLVTAVQMLEEAQEKLSHVDFDLAMKVAKARGHLGYYVVTITESMRVEIDTKEAA